MAYRSPFGLLSVIAFANGEALNEWVRENAIVIDSDDEATLVGITENEKWFVVLIDFPTKMKTLTAINKELPIYSMTLRKTTLSKRSENQFIGNRLP